MVSGEVVGLFLPTTVLLHGTIRGEGAGECHAAMMVSADDWCGKANNGDTAIFSLPAMVLRCSNLIARYLYSHL